MSSNCVTVAVLLRFMDDRIRIWTVFRLLLRCMSHCFLFCILAVVELCEPRLFISMDIGARLGGARVANTWQGGFEPYSPITQGHVARGTGCLFHVPTCALRPGVCYMVCWRCLFACKCKPGLGGRGIYFLAWVAPISLVTGYPRIQLVCFVEVH